MRTSRLHRHFGLWLVVCIGLAFGAPLTGAQTPATPPATPVEPPQPSIAFYATGDSEGSFFDAELKPGESTDFSVVLGNNGQVDFEAVTYAADAYTIRNGGFGLRYSDAEPSGPTTWLDYPTENFTATTGKTKERTFAVTVPKGTAPGEYVTGIAMQTADPVNEAPQEGMFRFDQYYRTVIPIRIIVPGDLAPSIDIGEATFVVEGGVPAISIPITNTGNLQTQPSGEIRVTDSTGNIVLSAPVQMGKIYGGHDTALWIGLATPLPEGTYSVAVQLDDKNAQISASAEVDLVVESQNAQVAVTSAPITIASAAVTPGPDANNVQFAVVDATIANTGEPIGNAQLSLLVSRDGEEVERFPISQALSLQTGDTAINTRYIPLEGWSSGEWTFELLLEQVEGSGAAVVVASQPIEGSITIP